MSEEIEHKYLLKPDFRPRGPSLRIRQGYLNRDKERTVRIRTVNDKGYLTIKGINVGGKASEFEYKIPLSDAKQMLEELCEGSLIEKTRYEIKYAGFVWEVDVFFGENCGLGFAEIELECEGQPYEKPPWIGTNVTGVKRYFNSRLSECPYSQWNDIPELDS